MFYDNLITLLTGFTLIPKIGTGLPKTGLWFYIVWGGARELQEKKHYRPAMPSGHRKKEDLSSSVLPQFKKYHPLETLKII